MDAGAEHTVYFDARTTRVVKITHEDVIGDGTLGAKGGAAEYFESLHLSNVLFNTGNRFEGITTPKGGGTPQVATSQPRIEGRKATRQEIAKDLESLGFNRVQARKDVNLWEHKGADVKIYDAVPSNVLRSSDGAFHYIDVNVIPNDSLDDTTRRLNTSPTAQKVDDVGTVLGYSYLRGSDSLKNAQDKFGNPRGLLGGAAQELAKSVSYDDGASSPSASDNEVSTLRNFAREIRLPIQAPCLRRAGRSPLLRHRLVTIQDEMAMSLDVGRMTTRHPVRFESARPTPKGG
jgi:hypothetical protein